MNSVSFPLNSAFVKNYKTHEGRQVKYLTHIEDWTLIFTVHVTRLETVTLRLHECA